MEENLFNNTNLNPVDTSLWSAPFTSPTPVDIPTSTYKEVTPLPKIDSSNLINMAKFQSSNQMMALTSKSNNNSILDIVAPNRGKKSISTTVDMRDTHSQLNDGTWLPKYKNYLPGVDNDTRLSKQQSGWEKFINPVQRLVSNVGKSPLDLTASVYGIGAAVMSGRFDAIHDNSYSKWIDDLTEKTNFEYKNYYNEIERNQNLGLNLQTWDKVLGGSEFTFRMIASELLLAAVTDGASLPASLAKMSLKAADKTSDLARVLKVGADISKMTKTARAPEMATALTNSTMSVLKNVADRGKFADNLVKARFAITSPIYESGFEARHFEKEANEQFWEHFRQKGTEPTQQEINDFSKNITGAANGVFMTNMAILAPSNLAMVGDFLNIKNPLSKAVMSSNNNWIKKNIFKIGTEIGEKGSYQALKPTFFNKTAAYLTPIIKGGLVEGVWEEGSQGIASNTYKNYVESSYDEELAGRTSTYIDAFSKSFRDQFSTKEGIEEIAIGALIGGLFGGVGGTRNAIKEYKSQDGIANIQNTGMEFFENFKSNVYTNEQLLSIFASGNRFQKIREQLDKLGENGDNLEKASLEVQSFISLFDAYTSVGKGDEFVEMFSNVLAGIDTKYVADVTGLSVEESENFKASQVQEMKTIAENYQTALDAGRYLFGKNVSGNVTIETEKGSKQINGNTLSNALAFSTTMAHFNEKFAADSFNAFLTKLSEIETDSTVIQKFGVLGALRSAERKTLVEYDNRTKQINSLKLQIGKIEKKLNDINNGENTPENANKRLEYADSMRRLTDDLNQLNSKQELLWRSLADNFYAKMDRTGFAPLEELGNVGDYIKELQTLMENRNYSPQDTLLLESLLNQFEKAHTSYESFVGMSNDLKNSKMSFRTYNHMFSAFRGKLDSSINDHTRDTLLKIHNFITPKSISDSRTFSRFNPITEELIEEKLPYKEHVEFIINKQKKGEELTELEQRYADKFKENIDAYEESLNDPLNSNSIQTVIDDLTVKRNAKQKELDDLKRGIYSKELQSKIDKLDDEIKLLENTENSNQIDQIDQLDKEIEELENKISRLEENESNIPSRIQRTVLANKNDYKQYEYTKPDGTVIIGSIKVVNGRLSIISGEMSDRVPIIDNFAKEENLDISKINGLRELQEDDILIEGNELYINGKLYKVSLRNKTLDNSISQDEDGNNIVELQAGNGRIVKFKGNVADAIVYEHLLNKLENEATESEIRELRERAERDAKIEGLYEELVSKTEDRTFEIQEQERLRSEKETDIKNKQIEILKLKVGRQIALEKEIDNSDNFVNKLEKIESLKNDIENIDKELLLEDSRYDSTDERVIRKNILEEELDLLMNEKTPFNPNGTPREQLEWVVNNIPHLEFENVSDVANLKEPSQSDVDEYSELLSVKNKNSVQKKRLAELRDKLIPFNLVNALNPGGVNLIDVINLYNQLNNIKSIKEEQKPVFAEADIQTINQSIHDIEKQDGYSSASVGIALDGVYIEKKKNGYKIYHIGLDSMLEKSLDNGFTPKITVFKLDSKGNKIFGETIEVTYDNLFELSEKYDGLEGVKVDLNEGLFVIKNIGDPSFYIQGEVDEYMQMMEIGAYAITGQPTGYIMVYDTALDGTMQPKESEFNITKDGVIIPIDKEVLNSLKEGDSVTLEFDPNDDYNKTLKSSEYETKGRIYIKKNGKIVNIVKGINSQRNGGQWDKLLALRKKAISEKTNIKLSNSYIGFPIITLNQNGSAIEHDIDENKVIAYGYIDASGEMKGDASSIILDNMQYILPLQKMGKISPFVVFEAYGKKIAFPINVRPKGVNYGAQVDEIINNEELTIESKMFQVNALLDAHGLLNDETALTNTNRNFENSKKLLTSVLETIDLTDNEQFKNADKGIFIDMNDPFKSSKLVLDLDSFDNTELKKTTAKIPKVTKEIVKTKQGKGKTNSDNKKC